MWSENHHKGSLFLVIIGTLVIGNLLLLDIVYFNKQPSQKLAISPQDLEVLPLSSANPNLDQFGPDENMLGGGKKDHPRMGHEYTNTRIPPPSLPQILKHGIWGRSKSNYLQPGP